MGLKEAKAGDDITFDRLPALSWSFDPVIGGKFGALRVEAWVPASSIVISDRMKQRGNTYKNL